LPADPSTLAAPKLAAPALAPSRPALAINNSGPVAAPLRVPSSARRVDPFARRFPPAGAPSIADRRVIDSRPSIAPSAPPEVLPQPGGRGRFVTVQLGDSLWKISRQTLGRGSSWLELLAANPAIVDPTHLAPGTRLAVPARQTLRKTASTRLAVQHGDTLSAIALTHYGRASLWRCVAQANPGLDDAARIYPGQALLLPAACNP
jgi:nucleoid-associated protein YgaU